MTLQRGDIIALKHQGNDRKPHQHPFLVINVFNDKAVVLQASSVKYEAQHAGFYDKAIYQEDCNGDTIDVNQTDGFKLNSIVLLNYDQLITDDDSFKVVGMFTNLEKLGQIIDRYLAKAKNLIKEK